MQNISLVIRTKFFVVVKQAFLCSPNAFANASIKLSKLFKIGNFFSNKEAKHDKACLVSNILINPTYNSTIGECFNCMQLSIEFD